MAETMRALTNDYARLTRLIATTANEVAARPAELRAVIEIGANSVKLLVAKVAGCSVKTVHKARAETELEHDFFRTRQLQPERIDHIAQVAGAFASQARQLETGAIRVIATSVARHALNQTDLLDAVEAVVKSKVEIISGDQAAEWVFDGASRDPNLFGLPLMVFDLGGGHTEFALGYTGSISFRHSFPLGSIRLPEHLELAVPPTLGDLSRYRDRIAEFLDRESGATVESGLKTFGGQRVFLVGAGGKFNVLSRLSAAFTGRGGPLTVVTQAGSNTSLSLDRLEAVIEWLWRSTRAERLRNPAITARRADRILTETVIVEAIMQRFDFRELYVSSRGLRHGALLGRGAAPTFVDPITRPSSGVVQFA